MLMTMVANHVEQNWWWSWAFVVQSGGIALVALTRAIAGGAAGAWWGLFVATLVLGSPATNTFTIPSFLDYLGAHLVAQSFSFDPAANAFGMVSSNSLGLYVGLP